MGEHAVQNCSPQNWRCPIQLIVSKKRREKEKAVSRAVNLSESRGLSAETARCTYHSFERGFRCSNKTSEIHNDSHAPRDLSLLAAPSFWFVIYKGRIGLVYYKERNCSLFQIHFCCSNKTGFSLLEALFSG